MIVFLQRVKVASFREIFAGTDNKEFQCGVKLVMMHKPRHCEAKGRGNLLDYAKLAPVNRRLLRFARNDRFLYFLQVHQDSFEIFFRIDIEKYLFLRIKGFYDISRNC